MLMVLVRHDDDHLSCLRTEPELRSYIRSSWFPGASDRDIEPILRLYSAEPSQGSPFGTGQMNAFTPENKRLAAIQGDWFFHSPRRQLLSRFSFTQPTYNFRVYLFSSDVYGILLTSSL